MATDLIHPSEAFGKSPQLLSDSQRKQAVDALAPSLQAFATKLATPRPDENQQGLKDAGLFSGEVETWTLLKSTFEKIDTEDTYGYRIATDHTWLDVTTEGDFEFYVSLYTRKDPAKPISEDNVVCIHRAGSLNPKDMTEDRQWNIAFAAAYMGVANCSCAREGRYNEWPGYGFPQAVFRDLPEELNTYSEGFQTNHLAAWQIDEPNLVPMLNRIGYVRAGVELPAPHGLHAIPKFWELKLPKLDKRHPM